MSASSMELMAAAVLSDDSDPTRLSWEEVEKSCGSWENFMRSYALNPSKQEDCEEALAISRGCKACQDEDETTSNQASGGATDTKTYKNLPKIGKWIKWNNGEEWEAQILDYADISGDYCSNPNMAYRVNIMYIDGEHDILCPKQLEQLNWSYCEAPSKEEIERAEKAAEYKRLNRFIGDRFCNTCKCNNKKLQLCTGCYKVYYCDAVCQRADWSNHKNECKREKIVLKPNPRYPLSEVSNKVKQDQIKTQASHHQILQDAMDGNFTVECLVLSTNDGDDVAQSLPLPLVVGLPIRNPKAGDLEHEGLYRLKTSNEGICFKFGYKGLEDTEHTKPEGEPTSCTLLANMMRFLTQEEFLQGGLHFLAGYSRDKKTFHFSKQELFWFMIINFKTFETVAPIHGPCNCNPKNVKAQMAPERRELRKRWNKIFKRAKNDINDVQCMFSDTEEGCHNYSDCPYKHDIEVKKDRKKRAQ